MPTVHDLLEPQIGKAPANDLSTVLRALRDGAQDVLGDRLLGIYLTGSFALGCGDLASDVDFLVVSSRDLTRQEEDGARELHRMLPERAEHWAHRLEGSWVSAAALRDPVGAHAPWLYVDNGSRLMEHSRHDDTWHGRWVFRHAAVALSGPAAAELVPAVPPSDMRAEAIAQADAREAWVRGEPDVVGDGWAQPYIVLTHCRLLWTATFGTIAGKAEAADWVRHEVAPAEFGQLIAASIDYRLRAFDPAGNRADPALAAPTQEFVTWATAEVHRRADFAH